MTCTPTSATETSCTGGADEDLDRAIDCGDADCATNVACTACTPSGATETLCGDGADDDCDGDVDCADDDCDGAVDCFDRECVRDPAC